MGPWGFDAERYGKLNSAVMKFDFYFERCVLQCISHEWTNALKSPSFKM